MKRLITSLIIFVFLSTSTVLLYGSDEYPKIVIKILNREIVEGDMLHFKVVVSDLLTSKEKDKPSFAVFKVEGSLFDNLVPIITSQKTTKVGKLRKLITTLDWQTSSSGKHRISVEIPGSSFFPYSNTKDFRVKFKFKPRRSLAKIIPMHPTSVEKPKHFTLPQLEKPDLAYSGSSWRIWPSCEFKTNSHDYYPHLYVGCTADIKIRVINKGGRMTRGTRARVKFMDQVNKSFKIPALPRNAIYEYAFKVKCTKKGYHDYKLTIDEMDKIEESDEKNNFVSLSVLCYKK